MIATNGNGKVNGQSRAEPIVEWPAPIDDTGMWGIAGEYVRMVEDYTEGDRNIILLAFLAFAGNYLGRNFYVPTGADRHYPNLYLCPVGTTATGRKGSGVAAAQAFFTEGPLAPGLPHLIHGISSGEGIMKQVRDPSVKLEQDPKTKETITTVIDPGIPDKRLMITLGEFQQSIAAMRRQESILSSVLRQAWDTGRIASPTKNNEIAVTGAHVSLIGCISKEELLLETHQVDAQNGTLNRFLFAASRRSKLQPEAVKFDELISDPNWTDMQKKFNANVGKAMTEDGSPRRMERDSDTQDGWGRNDKPGHGLYRKLSEPRAGMWGAVTARAAQQVIRLSEIAAVINGHRAINDDAQAAAAEQWRFCDHSARYIFGDRLNDPLAARIMVLLRSNGGGGTTRAQMHDTVRRPKEEIQESLTRLADAGLAYQQTQQTTGRPVERWYAQL